MKIYLEEPTELIHAGLCWAAIVDGEVIALATVRSSLQAMQTFWLETTGARIDIVKVRVEENK